MKKRLYLLEWKLRETRAWLGWMVFWIIISFMFLSAMLMTGHLLNKVVLQPVWLCIWSLPWLGFLLKVRVTEMDKGLVNTLQLGHHRLMVIQKGSELFNSLQNPVTVKE